MKKKNNDCVDIVMSMKATTSTAAAMKTIHIRKESNCKRNTYILTNELRIDYADDMN